MKSIYLLFSTLCLLVSNMAFGQVMTYDYRTANTSAVWSNASDWQVRGVGAWATASAPPGAGDNVFIQIGHSVTLTANAACKDINIENSTGNHLALASYTLSVNGTLRSFSQTSPAETGAGDGTLGSITYGTPTSSASWITSTTGKISIVGGTRNLTNSSQWGATNAGTASPNGFDLEINLNSGATATANTAIKARTVTINSGKLDMLSNTIACDMGATSGSNLTINSGGTLASSCSSAGTQVARRTATGKLDVFNLASGGTLILTGTTPCIDANSATMNGTVQYISGGTQTFLQKGSDATATSFTTYNNIIITTGTKNLANNITVNGTFSKQGSSTLVATLGALSYGAAATLEYGGSVAVSTGASEFPSANGPFNLRMNNSSSGVTMSFPRAIDGNLDLTLGVLHTTAANLLTLTNNATSTNGSASSFIDGPLRKTGKTPFTFPIGISSGVKYRPVSISAPANATDTFTAQYFNTPYATTTVNPANAELLDHISYKEYWDIARNTGSSSSVDVTLQWGQGSGVDGSSLSTLRLGHYNGTNWDNLGVNAVTANSIMQSGVSNFSPFTIATTSAAQALPVHLISFSGKTAGNEAVLDWTTTCEDGLKSFEVQRSIGILFETIAEKAANNEGCVSKSSYNYSDMLLGNGPMLYRLKMNDFSGRSIYSNTLRLGNSKAESAVLIAPNPATGKVQISGLEAGESYSVTDVSGRTFINGKAMGNQILLNLETLQQGIYFIRLSAHPLQYFVKQ